MIKRMRYRLAIGVAAFVVSVSLASIWSAHRAVSLCDVEANPERYAGKTIRFRAIVDRRQEFDPANGDYLSGCSKCDAETMAWASVKLDADSIKDFPLPRSHTTRSGEGDEIYLMDAIIVGRLEPPFGITGCFGPKHHITNARLERVLSLKKFEGMPQAIKWIESNSY